MGFTDTDADVEAAAGKPVSDIFIDDGEPAFRELERAAVATALARRSDGVVALGGGAVLDPQTQAGSPGTRSSTWRPGSRRRRSGSGFNQARPLLIGNPRATLKILLDQRLPVYERLATITVATDDREPDEIAAEIADRRCRHDSTGRRAGGTGDRSTRITRAAAQQTVRGRRRRRRR